MNSRTLLPLFALTIACTSSSGTTPITGDAGADGASTDASDPLDDGAPGPPTCGAPPWVTLNITLQGQTVNGQSPVEGVRYTSPLCPTKQTLSDVNGKIIGRVSKGVAFYGRFEKDQYASTLVAEQKYDKDLASFDLPMLPSFFGGIIPGFGPDKTAIFLGATADAAGDAGVAPCNALDGITFAVPGHPEATVTYYSASVIPQATTGTSTTTSGRASITGLAVGDPVVVTGAKPGCTVSLVSDTSTGRAPLAAGFITLMSAHLKQ